MRDASSSWSFPLSVLLAIVVTAGASGAHDSDGDDPLYGRQQLAPLAHRIAGGASLLLDIDRSRAAQAFHDRAHHFEEVLDDRDERRIDDDWRALRRAYDEVRRRGDRRDPRSTFVIDHLAEDLARGDRAIGLAARGGGAGPGDAGGRIALIDRETCVGWNRVGPRPCPSSRESITFSMPRGITTLRQMNAEWRDFGRGTNAEVYVNDRLVWRTDVAKDWDPDGKRLDLRVWPGSTVTVRSSNGDPIWIRRFDIEAAREGDRF